MKNTGRKSEDIFDAAWARLGKAAHVFVFTDAAEARGMNGKHVTIKPQPSDRLVTYRGHTFYAEVKSTTDERGFKFSLLRKTQGAYAIMTIAAGGTYDLFIHSLAFDAWYRVPYSVIQAIKNEGRASMTWLELQPYRWEFPLVP